jgi:hypothetical protein
MRNGMTNVPNRLMNVPAKRIHAAGGRARKLSRKVGIGGEYREWGVGLAVQNVASTDEKNHRRIKT